VGHLVMFVFRIKLLSCVVSMVRVWNIVRFHWPKRSIEKEQTYQSFKAYIYTCILKLHTCDVIENHKDTNLHVLIFLMKSCL